MTGANLGIQSFSVAITLLLLLCNRLDRDWSGRVSRVMNWMLWTNIALLLCYLFTRLLEGNPSYVWLNYILTCGKCGLGYFIALLYTDYILCSIPKPRSGTKQIARAAVVICLLAAFLNVVSIFNHMYFSCEGGVYSRGPLFLLNQTFAAFVVALDMALLLHNRKELGARTVVCLLSYTFLPILAIFVQIPNPDFDTMCVATTLSLLIIYVTVHVERGRQLAEKEKELTESRMAVMLSQIQPHFLYNALAVIQNMCHGKAPEAEETTVEFAEFLRGNLDSISLNEPIPFERELRHTQTYLSIECKRFKDILKVEYDIRTMNFQIPALTLQPIVENAVRYGVTRRENGGTVRITTAEDESTYSVTVMDDGVGFDAEEPKTDGRTHIGIANVRGRLDNMCGGTLSIQSEKDRGTTAVIRIPKRERK